MRHTIYSNSDPCIFVLILTRIPHLCLDRTCPQTTHRINRNNNIADWFQRNLAICELVSDIKKQSFKKKLPRTRKEERDGKKEEPWRWNKTQITESHMRARTRTRARARTYKNRIKSDLLQMVHESADMSKSQLRHPQWRRRRLTRNRGSFSPAWSGRRCGRRELRVASPILNLTVLQSGSAWSTSSTLPW